MIVLRLEEHAFEFGLAPEIAFADTKICTLLLKPIPRLLGEVAGRGGNYGVEIAALAPWHVLKIALKQRGADLLLALTLNQPQAIGSDNWPFFFGGFTLDFLDVGVAQNLPSPGEGKPGTVPYFSSPIFHLGPLAGQQGDHRLGGAPRPDWPNLAA